MENLVVTTFQNAQAAGDGLNRLKELDQLGDISIYNMAMIRKTDEKQFELLHHEGPDTEAMPATGAITGSLIGAIAGPLGMAIGMLTGVMVGSLDEHGSEDRASEFLDRVSKQLTPGTYAIVLDVEEDGEFIVNSYMEPFQGKTTHTDIAGLYDEYDEEQWDELDKEIDDEEKEWKNALDKDKASIKVKIDKLKAEQNEKLAKTKIVAAERKNHLQTKINALDQRIKAGGEKAKEKLQERKEKLNQSLTQWNDKMDWAFA